MTYRPGTVPVRRADDKAEAELIEQWAERSAADRKRFWSALTDRERKILTDAFGGRDARGD